jgi:hypothetical protein
VSRALFACLTSLVVVPAFAAMTPDEILRSSLDLLSHAQNVRVRASVMSDEVTNAGIKLQRSMDVQLRIQRPGALALDIAADRYDRTLRYDGKQVAVADLKQKLYATTPAPPTLDGMIAQTREQLDLDLPLGHLFATDTYEKLKAARKTEAYVGLHKVGNDYCHHLAFTQDNADWQIWIVANGMPVPRKIVIDYKNRPGRPQYIAVLSDWNLNAKFSPGDFAFTPPAGAQKIEFVRTGR